jgi:hypothetical protein
MNRPRTSHPPVHRVFVVISILRVFEARTGGMNSGAGVASRGASAGGRYARTCVAA